MATNHSQPPSPADTIIIPALVERLIDMDPPLAPYRPALSQRLAGVKDLELRITGGKLTLPQFACGHEFFGLHFNNDHWVLREWAPNASAVHLLGDMSHWRVKKKFALKQGDQGLWEIALPADTFGHGALYRLHIQWPGGGGDRIPAYARRVVQDPKTHIFNAQVWHPEHPYQWRHSDFKTPAGPLFIYEAHVGMAQEALSVGTYREFTRHILPRIVSKGYNTLQLMAVQEHPYYASFGYQISNFFAPSSRFGTPDDLKALVDAAHGAGLTVLMDLIHSHAVSNEVEGLSRFDGTLYQYFHAGSRGHHRAWNSRCFDYGKPQVLHFLLSNCRYWLDEFHFDGFRFDGVTSMLYHHHGLEKEFTSYADYFDGSVDDDAWSYMCLANDLIHAVKPSAITVAEDISGMPGLAVSTAFGGAGFDYRFAMGVPDYWIRLIKEYKDEDWPMGHLWHELTNRRKLEKTISYAECHDQALVGDQTLAFRLMGAQMYAGMHQQANDLSVDRGVSLHKLIRLITLATAGDGYLNFMGNEFGHPEWIDFPREGNQWSFQFARRQWSLTDDPDLKYGFLERFDLDMLSLAMQYNLLTAPAPHLLVEHNDDKIIAFERSGLLLAFNFHPSRSYPHYRVAAPAGVYRLIFHSDRTIYCGHGRLENGRYYPSKPDSASRSTHTTVSLYLPSRCAMVLAPQ